MSVKPTLVNQYGFTLVEAATVRELGGDATAALVLSRLIFRLHYEEVGQDGRRWWRSSMTKLAEETGLSLRQVERVMPKLVGGGYVTAQKFHRDGTWDQTLSYTVIWEEVEPSPIPPNGGMETAKRWDVHPTKRWDVPSIKELEEEVSEARTDVCRLLDRLDAGIEGNEAKKPERTKANISAARLLLDRDKRDEAEALRLIDWATSDSFWRSNILSMVKFRAKYDQLRLQAGRNGAEQNQRSRIYDGDMEPFEGDPDDIEAWTAHRENERERIWRERGEW